MLKQETKIVCNHENSFGQHYGFIALAPSLTRLSRSLARLKLIHDVNTENLHFNTPSLAEKELELASNL